VNAWALLGNWAAEELPCQSPTAGGWKKKRTWQQRWQFAALLSGLCSVPRMNAGVGVVTTKGSGKDEGSLRPSALVVVIVLQNNREWTSGDNSE
jgi:hypothetical protein